MLIDVRHIKLKCPICNSAMLLKKHVLDVKITNLICCNHNTDNHNIIIQNKYIGIYLFSSKQELRIDISHLTKTTTVTVYPLKNSMELRMPLYIPTIGRAISIKEAMKYIKYFNNGMAWF